MGAPPFSALGTDSASVPRDISVRDGAKSTFASCFRSRLPTLFLVHFTLHGEDTMSPLSSHLDALIASSTDDASELDRRAIEEWTRYAHSSCDVPDALMPGRIG